MKRAASAHEHEFALPNAALTRRRQLTIAASDRLPRILHGGPRAASQLD